MTNFPFATIIGVGNAPGVAPTGLTNEVRATIANSRAATDRALYMGAPSAGIWGRAHSIPRRGAGLSDSRRQF